MFYLPECILILITPPRRELAYTLKYKLIISQGYDFPLQLEPSCISIVEFYKKKKRILLHFF